MSLKATDNSIEIPDTLLGYIRVGESKFVDGKVVNENA